MPTRKTKRAAKPKTTRRPTKFVPRIVASAAVVCVIPLCVMACNGPSTGVAADAFGVADTGFPYDVSVADSGFRVADTGFSVADVGFDAGNDAPSVAADAFGVADVAFQKG